MDSCKTMVWIAVKLWYGLLYNCGMDSCKTVVCIAVKPLTPYNQLGNVTLIQNKAHILDLH